MKHHLLLKSLLVTFLVLTLALHNANAQYAYWGLKGGYQANKITGLSFNSKMASGFNIGIFGNFILSEKFSLEHELLYTQRGFGGTTKDSVNVGGTLPYIDLPWLLYYHPNRALQLQIGVQPSLYMFWKNPQPTASDFSKYNVNPIDFSGIIGAGFILDNNFMFGARITASLMQTFNTTEFGGRNMSLQAYVGYAVNRKVFKKRKKKKK